MSKCNSARSSSSALPTFIKCYCSIQSPLRTATIGEFPGRQFYGCRNYNKVNKCKFFVWADEIDEYLAPQNKGVEEQLQEVIRKLHEVIVLLKMPKNNANDKTLFYCMLFVITLLCGLVWSLAK